jgi:hypothetical protein
MEFRNGILLQLFECIESTLNEVKRKMIKAHARNAAPKSLVTRARRKVCAMRATHSHADDRFVVRRWQARAGSWLDDFAFARVVTGLRPASAG